MKKRSLSYRTALGGTLASMCLVCQFITGVFPMFYIIMPMICGVLVTVMAREAGTKWGFLMYFAVSLLSLFITPNKEAALIFIMFFGHYPLLRPSIAKIKPYALSYALRLIFFNVCIVSYFGLTILLFGAEEMLEGMGDFGKYSGFILLAMADTMFISYDYLMELAGEMYAKKIRPIISGRQKK